MHCHLFYQNNEEIDKHAKSNSDPTLLLGDTTSIFRVLQEPLTDTQDGGYEPFSLSPSSSVEVAFRMLNKHRAVSC